MSASVDVDKNGATAGGVEPRSDNNLVIWGVVKLVGLPSALKFHDYNPGGVPDSVFRVNLGVVENQLAAVFGQCRDRGSLVGANSRSC